MKIFTVLVQLLFLIAPPDGLAQTSSPESDQSHGEKWQSYSSPDGSFRIDSPVPLQRTDCFGGAEDSEGEFSEAAQGITCYSVERTFPASRSFSVVVIDGNHPESRSKSAEERVGGLWFLIGGDDPAEETTIQANGLAGTEYAYSTTTRNGFYARGRVSNSGESIYIVIFHTERSEDLTSPDAERFFNSFYPRG